VADILSNITQSGSAGVSTESLDSQKIDQSILGDGEYTEFSQALRGQAEVLDTEFAPSSLETGIPLGITAEQLESLASEDTSAADGTEELTAGFLEDPQIDQILPPAGKFMPVEGVDPTQVPAVSLVADPSLDTIKKLDLDSTRDSKGMAPTSGRWFSLLNQTAERGQGAQATVAASLGKAPPSESGMAVAGGLQSGADLSSFAQVTAAGGNQANLDSNPPIALTQVQTSVTVTQDQSGNRQTITEQFVEIPVGKSGWGQELGSKVVWMVGQNIQTAQIQITPREMGPIEIRISVQQDQATVNFTAQNGQTREAIESALPRLREMLDQSGLQLAHTDVSDQQTEQQETRFSGDEGREGDDRIADTEGDPAVAVSTSATINGLVDFYA